MIPVDAVVSTLAAVGVTARPVTHRRGGLWADGKRLAVWHDYEADGHVLLLVSPVAVVPLDNRLFASPPSPLGGVGDAPGLADPHPCPVGATTQGGQP